MLKPADRTRTIQNLFHKVRSRAGLLDEVLATELELAALGSGADQRATVCDNNPPWPGSRYGGVHDDDAAVARPVCDLLHGVSLSPEAPTKRGGLGPQ